MRWLDSGCFLATRPTAADVLPDDAVDPLLNCCRVDAYSCIAAGTIQSAITHPSDQPPSRSISRSFVRERGVGVAWATWGEPSKGQLRTYNLRPELKGLRPATLFAWGDKDYNGPPTLGQEMAAMAQHAPGDVHRVWLDQPERCARLTVEFLKAEGDGSSRTLERHRSRGRATMLLACRNRCSSRTRGRT